MKDYNHIFNQFIENHGKNWFNVTELFGTVDGLLLAVTSAWEGEPVMVYDKQKDFTYFPYVRCYMSPALKLNPIKKFTLNSLIKSKCPTETNVDIWYKNPLEKN